MLTVLDSVTGKAVAGVALELTFSERRLSATTDEEGTTDAAPWSPSSLPGDLDRIRSSLAGLPGQVDAVARTIARTVQTARTIASRNREAEGTLPPAPFQAPQTSINGAISSHRRVAFADLPLADIRRVAGVFGGTTNDIVLAATAGALRTFFASRDEEPDSSLIALVPVSVRSEAEQGALGNRVSAMLVSLATGVADPVARLGRIREGVAAAKEQSRSIGPARWARRRARRTQRSAPGARDASA